MWTTCEWSASAMRILVTLIFLLCPIGVSSQTQPEWTRVYTFDESVIDMNTSVITRITTDVTRVRFRWTFAQSQSFNDTTSLKYQSQLEVMELNCSKETYRPYHLTFLSAAGEILRVEDSPGEWQSIAPGSMTEKLFIPACTLINKKTVAKTVAATKAPVEAKLEKVARYSSDFAQQLAQEKNFKPVIKKFFAADFLDGYLSDPRHNWFFNLNQDVARKLSRKELERYYVAAINAGYLSAVFLISQSASEDEDRPATEKLLPPDVLQLVDTHPYTTKYRQQASNYNFLAEQVDSVERLRSYTDLLEKIGLLMRAHVVRVDAEKSMSYREMLDESDLYDPKVRKCARDCLGGLPDGSKLFEVNVPLLRLQVAEFGGRLKVVSATARY